MASNTLDQIVSELKAQAKKSNRPVNRILKIKNADSIVLQLNAIPDNGNVRISMTIHRRNNFQKQIGITANDAESLIALGQFLQKYSNLLNKYVKFSITSRQNTSNEVEIDLDDNNNNTTEETEDNQEENDNEPEETQQQPKRNRNRNVEDEF